MKSANMFSIQKRYRSAVIFVVATLVTLVSCALLPRVRIGDGSEYYAMFYAWADGGRPYMTDKAWDSFDKLANGTAVSGYFLTKERLKAAFKALSVRDTQDFNHFWLYSSLAAGLAFFPSFAGVDILSHWWFMLLHALLFGIFLWLAYKYWGTGGVLAAILVVVFSPTIWFVNKVHTEFFTVIVVSIALLYYSKGKNIFSALFFSLAAAQNISFSVLTLAVLVFELLDYFKTKKRYSAIELIVFSIACLISLLHPLYYFFRYGVITPQLFAGGASMGENWKYAYAWLLDPDVGLLPNWPLGAVALSLGIAHAIRKNSMPGAKTIVLMSLYVLICLYAQSSTVNLNSGGSPDVSRYSLWYIPMFLPMIRIIIDELGGWNRIARSAVLGLALAVGIFNIFAYNPVRPEDNRKPTKLSYLIQKYAPYAYNPPSEIFAERYSGKGDALNENLPQAIFGPGNAKVLLYKGPGTYAVSGVDATKLFIDKAVMQAYLSSLGEAIPQGEKSKYFVVDIEKLKSMKQETIAPGIWYPVNKDNLDHIVLVRGWSNPESWGVWSDGETATISIPKSSGLTTVNLSLQASVFLNKAKKPLHLSILDSKAKMIWTGDLDQTYLGGGEIALGQIDSSVENTFVFKISNPTSPKSQGASQDPRLLGIGLIGYRIESSVKANM